MYWCLAMRSGENLRPQRAHATRPSASGAWMAVAAPDLARLAETADAEIGAPPPQPQPRDGPLPPCDLIARHFDMCKLSSALGSCIPHAGQSTIMISCLRAHCSTCIAIECLKSIRPQCGHGMLGGGMLEAQDAGDHSKKGGGFPSFVISCECQCLLFVGLGLAFVGFHVPITTENLFLSRPPRRPRAARPAPPACTCRAARRAPPRASASARGGAGRSRRRRAPSRRRRRGRRAPPPAPAPAATAATARRRGRRGATPPRARGRTRPRAPPT